MPPKPSQRPLRELELTGWRRGVRRAVLLLLTITAALTALAAVLGALEVALGMLVAPAAIYLAIVATRTMNRRFPRGIWTGLVATLIGSVSLALLAMTLHRDTPFVVGIAMLGSLAMFALGPLLMTVEVLVHLAERARLRRDADPVFPEARVVER